MDLTRTHEYTCFSYTPPMLKQRQWHFATRFPTLENLHHWVFLRLNDHWPIELNRLIEYICDRGCEQHITNTLLYLNRSIECISDFVCCKSLRSSTNTSTDDSWVYRFAYMSYKRIDNSNKRPICLNRAWAYSLLDISEKLTPEISEFTEDSWVYSLPYISRWLSKNDQ